MTNNSDIDNTSKPRLREIVVDYESTKKIINSLSNGAVMGPDDLPVQVYNYGGEFIARAMTDITKQLVETGEILSFLKKVEVHRSHIYRFL